MRITPRLFSLAALLLVAGSCDKFDAPPEIAIIGLKDGRLADSKAPVELAFSEPIDPASLRVKIIRYQTDVEGNLADEPNAAPGTETPEIFSWVGGAQTGGVGELLDNNTRFRITPDKPLPIGPSLALLVEPGLRDGGGTDTKVRRKIRFGYGFSCKGNTPAGPFGSGQFFFLVDVLKPLQLKVELWGVMRVDPQTGAMVGQFSNADRLVDPGRCSPACDASEVCQTLPGPPQCVAPSLKAGSVDEFPDFFANDKPPAGFAFLARGCAEEQTPGIVAFGNDPVDAALTIPRVTIKGIVLSGSFAVDPQGVLRGSGTFTADDVLLFNSPSGPGEGTFTARLIPKEQERPDAPAPP